MHSYFWFFFVVVTFSRELREGLLGAISLPSCNTFFSDAAGTAYVCSLHFLFECN